ncbi:hypothetical protein GCM10010423_22710 [Streptomyces levis]|uniref:Uncharacterized protein n=1 Tax=Streptomyces levis TaxID=285566 RepID=A0ABP6AYE8_9ACTN
MPATRVPEGRDLRCDAKGGDSFQRSAYRVSCRVRAGGSEGLPYGLPGTGVGPIHPKVSVGPRLRLPLRHTGLGGGRAARRRSPVRVMRPGRTVANWCGACEG